MPLLVMHHFSKKVYNSKKVFRTWVKNRRNAFIACVTEAHVRALSNSVMLC